MARHVDITIRTGPTHRLRHRWLALRLLFSHRGELRCGCHRDIEYGVVPMITCRWHR